ncbi:MAG TPA: single-stranded-DNA-specific exonuclease RecJ, partial [Bacteroidales bacterium]|nr:single-stranded-DNA-specific exonuclease RecJ [Bacteroidales bacterium]
MEKRWIFKDTPDIQEVQRLSEELNIEQPLAALLLQRGFSELEEIDDFFDPKIEKLHDPFLMLDMDKAVQRLSQAIENNEKIMVYGDY